MFSALKRELYSKLKTRRRVHGKRMRKTSSLQLSMVFTAKICQKLLASTDHIR